jgi:diguanylate cyclase (GGDEF)-like protein
MLVSLRELFAPREDPYAGGDLETAARLGAAICLLGAAFGALLTPFSPPDAAIGAWGWLVLGAFCAVALAVSVRTRRRGIGWDALLVYQYAGVAQIAVVHWLCGGGTSPFAEMYLLVAVFAGAVHPARRVVGVLAAIAVAAALPLAYDGWSNQIAAQTGTRLVLWSGLALVASALMHHVRAQRVRLRETGERAERLARVDELTGLPNRRAFDEALAAEIARARRADAPLCLVLADLDGFKAINDRSGHLVGDACLRDVADALRDQMRPYDACFRWGGDEFAVLMPQTNRQEAEVACERLSAFIERRCGLGVTCAPAQLADGMTGTDLMRVGDAALLDRKARRPRLRLV